MKTFKHSGDIGDILYSLYTVKKLGGGIYYMDPTGGLNDPQVANGLPERCNKFNKNSYDFLYPLLKQQSYIKDVCEWNGETCDINFNVFRRDYKQTLLHSHLNVAKIPLNTVDHNEPWLNVDDEIKLDRDILINRTPRYNSNYTWYYANRHDIAKTAIFVGLEKEHEIFEYTFNIKIPHYKFKDGLEAAKIIKGSKCLIANQSSILAIAIGLKTTRIIQEFYPPAKDCYFENMSIMKYI
jgi:hypothetical protein